MSGGTAGRDDRAADEDGAAGADRESRRGDPASPELPPIELPTPEDAERLGARLARLLRAGDVVALDGPLGAGKTTLVRGLGEGLGVRGPIQSPTFVIARTHPSLVGGPALIHVDAYRLASPAELEDLDLDLEASVTVIEWGREAAAALARSRLELELERPRAAGGARSSAEPALPGGSAPEAEPEPELDAPAPRIARLRALGPRWTEPGVAAALGALGPR